MHNKIVWIAVLLLAACADETHTPINTSSLVENTKICEVQNEHAQNDEESTPLFTPLKIEPVHSLHELLGNIPARKTTSLNGQWRIIVDQLGVGDASPLLRGGVGENDHYEKTELLEYAFSDAHSLTVPGDWNSQSPELFWYRGIVWYQKEFQYELSGGRRAFLYFGGANFSKDIYLNGRLLARHKGGFTPFNVEITQYLRSGKNAVVVKVDSLSGPAEIPTEYNDWLNYGGITRDVLLVETAPNFVRNYKVQLQPDSLNTVTGWVEVDFDSRERSKSLNLTLEIPEAGITREMSIPHSGRVEFEFEADLELWSPGSPKLYEVRWEYDDEVLSDQIGFRSIATSQEDILLNGKPVFLKGISMHEESLLRAGRANSPADAQAVVNKLKRLNANFVRLAHYPHNEHMVRAADAAGIMVWAEMPVYHNIQFSNPCTLDSAKQQYSELIARDQNRAAVVLWSLGNETQEGPARNIFFTSMAKHVRGLDNTRPLTAALLGFGGMEAIGRYLGRIIAGQKNTLLGVLPNPEPVTISIGDPLGELVDVIGYNQYLGWYLSGILTQKFKENGLEVSEQEVRDLMLSEMHRFSITTEFGKPLVISEFGAGAKFGKRGAETNIWSEEYQARVYRQQLRMLENSPALRGLSPWILKDFRAPYRLNTREQDYWNRKGLLSEKGEEKLAFDVLSEFYRAIDNDEFH